MSFNSLHKDSTSASDAISLLLLSNGVWFVDLFPLLPITLIFLLIRFMLEELTENESEIDWVSSVSCQFD